MIIENVNGIVNICLVRYVLNWISIVVNVYILFEYDILKSYLVIVVVYFNGGVKE